MVSARTCLELGSGQGSSAPLHAVAIPGSGLTGSPCWSSQGHPARLSAMELSASSASPFCSLHPPGQPVNPHPQPKLMMSLEGQGQEERHGRQSCSLGPQGVFLTSPSSRGSEAALPSTCSWATASSPKSTAGHGLWPRA